jgi:quercetin dioxygenase-like cupin family protein
MAKTKQATRTMWSRVFPYDEWMESTGLPIHKGYYIEDLRTLELGWWEERQCNAAFIQLVGQEGVTSTRMTEIPPGKTLTRIKPAVDEIVYVVEGRGLTSVWIDDGPQKQNFEWQQHSMFLLPRHENHQIMNMQGEKPARLLHYSYLPMAMSAIPEPDFYFDNNYDAAPDSIEADVYSEAKLIKNPGDEKSYVDLPAYWYGNFFPDMRAWDKLDANAKRGAGGKTVLIQFANSELTAHMSEFAAQTYKKAHRHGPGRAILIPRGEGYSIMWEEGKDKIVVPWQECSMLTPPDRWFHQHFNVGSTAARYLAMHPPMQFHGHAEKVEDRAKDQIEYPDEDPFIRQKFEEELAKRGLESLVPPEAYTNREFAWSKGMGKK